MVEAKPRYLTTKETAEMLRISPHTLEGFRRDGRGPSYIRVGKRNKVLYEFAAVLAWVGKHTVNPE